jgi:hypothetical protein
MAFDAHTNFAYSTVATAPSPATTGTTLTVAAGAGANFPAAPFNCTVWGVGSQPTYTTTAATTAEIIRVTSKGTGDNWTIVRLTEDATATARTIIIGDQIAATLTKKTFTDIEGSYAAPVTMLTYQNRQLGASTQSSGGQNSLWIVPFRVPGGAYVSCSSLLFMQSFSGTVSSNVTATWAQTVRWALYSNNTSNSTRLDSWISSSYTGQIWLNSNTSASIGWEGFASNSQGTGLITAQFFGPRLIPQNIGSSIPPGLYAFAFAASTSTAGYNLLVTNAGFIMDAPVTVGMGTIGAATTQTVGFVDAGTYSVVTGGIPSSIGFSEILQTLNVVPFIKMGAI